MKLANAFDYKTSSSSSTRPSFTIAKCTRPDASRAKRLRRKDGLTPPPLQQQQIPHHLSTKMPLPPNCGSPMLKSNAQLMDKSPTNAVACTTMQPCAEDSRDLTTQSIMLEPNLPVAPELDHPKAAGPIHRLSGPMA